jgi:hypothetical protein
MMRHHLSPADRFLQLNCMHCDKHTAVTMSCESIADSLLHLPFNLPPFYLHSQEWNLVEFLPRALHQPMQLLLAEWMYLPWQEANRAAAAARGATQGGSQAVLDTRQAEQIQVGVGALLL